MKAVNAGAPGVASRLDHLIALTAIAIIVA
jgi:hypothetical protein